VNRLIMSSSDRRRDGMGLPPPIVHNRLSDDEERYIIWPMLRPKRDNRHPRYAPGRLCHYGIADSLRAPKSELPGFGVC
jgi:hypothetical protein